MDFVTVFGAGLASNALYDQLKGYFKVSSLLVILIGALLLYLVLTGRLQGFWNGITG